MIILFKYHKKWREHFLILVPSFFYTSFLSDSLTFFIFFLISCMSVDLEKMLPIIYLILLWIRTIHSFCWKPFIFRFGCFQNLLSKRDITFPTNWMVQILPFLVMREKEERLCFASLFLIKKKNYCLKKKIFIYYLFSITFTIILHYVHYCSTIEK